MVDNKVGYVLDGVTQELINLLCGIIISGAVKNLLKEGRSKEDISNIMTLPISLVEMLLENKIDNFKMDIMNGAIYLFNKKNHH